MTTHPISIDKYMIIRHLGNGKFGNVYLAQDRALNTQKAIKVLDLDNPHEYQKKLEEAQLLHKCRHKHIVKINEANIYEVDNKQKVVIDMEYISGGSLENYLKGQFLSTIKATKYMQDILFGLEYLHNQDVLHRDIKPANIMLADDLAKLSDFGLATSAGENLVGSPNGYTPHLAPEIFISGVWAKTTVLTDIFAAGITYFRIASNLPEWKEWKQKILQISNRKILENGTQIDFIGFPAYIPKKIQRIIKKACSADPTKRYQSALEMRQAIEKLHPNIDWLQQADNSWEGEDQNGNLFTGTCLPSYEVVIKKNNRKITDVCKKLSSKPSAETYMLEYIANTTYQ